MNEDLRKRIMEHIIDVVEGGTGDSIMTLIDTAIDEGYITQGEYDQNSSAIHDLIDTWIFECVVCGWTLPVDMGGEDTESGELACSDCRPSED